MAEKPRFPQLIRVGAATVKIYRNRAKSTADGYVYVVAWIGADGREREARASYPDALDLARQKAKHLSQGFAEGANASRADFVELHELRTIAHQGGRSTLAAMAEWAQARAIAGDGMVEACHEWAERRAAGALKRITLPDAVDKMIAEKNKLSKSGDRVYKSKLKYAVDHEPFRGVTLDGITEPMWTALLETFEDPVTRNDIRKRCITLCRWAQRKNHLPKKIIPAIEETERAKEFTRKIGIISPATRDALLELFLRDDLQRHLAALVIACGCGLRVEEIHGKRGNTQRRQMWEDIHLERGFLSVSAAKENTPSNRIVHLSEWVRDWLWRCPDAEGRRWGHQRGPVCQVNAITRIRDIATTHGHRLPENCFRHSWISYRIARTGKKDETATEAGNSVKEIDKRYRVPLPKELGEQWEKAFIPTDAGSTPPRPWDRSGSSDA